MKVPFGISAPEWVARFGAKNIFKTDPELALYGRYVKSERLEVQGFEFKILNIERCFGGPHRIDPSNKCKNTSTNWVIC